MSGTPQTSLATKPKLTNATQHFICTRSFQTQCLSCTVSTCLEDDKFVTYISGTCNHDTFCFALEHRWGTQDFLSLQADCGVAAPQPHSPSLHLSYLKKPKMTSISPCCKAVVRTWTAHLAYSFQSSSMSYQKH